MQLKREKLMSNQNNIARNSILITIIMGVSSILGLVRESSVAYMFGASGTTDAYLIAMIIPTLVTSMLTSSLTSTFVTVYVGYLAKGDSERAVRLANIVLSIFILVLGGTSVLFLLVTPSIVHLIAPSYVGTHFILTVDLTRIMIPNVLFGGLLGVLIGINNSHHSFIAPASVGLVANIIMLVSIFALGSIWGIYGLAVGTVLGVLAQFCMQIPSACSHGYRFNFILDINDPGVKEITVLVIPFIFSAAAGQISLVVNRMLATELPEGALSALYFADKIVFLPSLFVGAVSTVIYPTLVHAATLRDWPKLMECIVQAIRMITLVLIPSTILIYVLRIPLVTMLFERGEFTFSNTLATANTIPYLLGALFLGALVSIFINIYFATQKMVAAVGIGVIAVGVNIGLSIILVKILQQKGLALATTLSTFSNVLLQIIGLYAIFRIHENTDIPYRELGAFFLKVLLSVLLMAIIVNIYYKAIQGHLSGLNEMFIAPISGLMLGTVSFLVLSYVIRIEEVRKGFDWCVGKITQK